MRTTLTAGSGWLLRGAAAERWSHKNQKERADLLYQVATLAAAALLLLTASAI